MKEFKLIGSIIPNTNKVISQSYSDWRGIQEGNLIKFNGDNVFYQTSRVEPFFYIADFEASDEFNLIVKNNTSVYLNKGDSIVISYKEYEAVTILNILNGGRNYQVNDILFFDGGIPSQNIEDNTEKKAWIRVLEVLPGGIITKLQIENRGKYIRPPESKCTIKGGHGTGGTVEAIFKMLDTRALIERDIANIIADSETKITLNYPIPASIKDGKLSTEKYILTLIENYGGKSKNGDIFEVTKNFTPNFKWPLLVQNSFSIPSLVNISLINIDKKVKDLENRIKELEQKLKE